MVTKILNTTKPAISHSIQKTVFLSFIIIILFVTNARGQDLLDQKLSLKEVNVQLSEVLHTLELKSNFTFSYLNNELPLNESVTINVKDETFRNILDILANRFSLNFSRIKNIITVKKNEKKKEERNENNIAHTFGTLRGTVRDSTTSENLPYASINIRETSSGASTDTRGYFIIPSIPAKKEYSVIASYVGYKSKAVKVYIEENVINDIHIYLKKSDVEKEDIVVTDKRLNAGETTSQKISIKDFENMTFGVETDILRAIQLQPGVQSTGDVSARYYVRGGASNENSILLNGTPIYNPFHALGIFSVIDPDMINSVEFSKGGFGAQYEGRLSSVTDIVTKDGNKNNFGATAAVSQLTVKTSLEGPIPNGSFIITGRKSYSTEILQKFTNGSNIPVDFYDVSFKVNYSIPEDISIVKITGFGFLSKDKIDYSDKLRANYDWSNSLIGLNCFAAEQNSPTFGEVTLYYSQFTGNEIPNSANDKLIKNGVYDLTLKLDLNYVRNDRSEFYGGFKVTNLNTKLILSNTSGATKDVGLESIALSGYGGFKLLSINNLKADIGTRLNIMNLTEGASLAFEPRANVFYSLLPTLNLKAAWGLYQQELATISDEDEILALFEPWIIIPKYLKPSTSLHYIGGVEYYLTEKLKLNIEGYYKVMQNLVVLNDQVIFPTDQQLINASGKSHGAEITMNYSNSWINTQLSYSYSWTIKKVRDIEYHPRYDSRNNVKFFVNFDLGNNWRAGISWNYNSGLPYTQIYGYYSILNPAEIFNSQSLLDNTYQYLPIFAARNAAHLPDYHRLDVNLSKKIRIGPMNMSVDLSIINVYNRKNFFYFDIKTGERINMLPFFPTIEIKAEL